MQQELNNAHYIQCPPTGGGTALSSAYYGPGTGSIWLDDVGCVGTESRLVDCPNAGIGTFDCIHLEDASIQCNAGAILHAKMYICYTINGHSFISCLYCC